MSEQSAWVMVPKAALDWLFGQHEDGFERPEGMKGAFWWRAEFRRRIASLSCWGEPVMWTLYNPDTGNYLQATFKNRTDAELKAHQRSGNYTKLEARPLYASPQPSRESAEEEKGVGLPADVIETVLATGPAEWGATAAMSTEAHAAHITESINWTANHFGQAGDQQMHGLYQPGGEIVICHVGTSPNSPGIARALTGAWNWLHAECQAALSTQPHETDRSLCGERPHNKGWRRCGRSTPASSTGYAS